METKNRGLLKRTQTQLINGAATNPISVSVESTNQGGFHTKVLMRDHSIDSDQPFGFDGKNQGPKPSELVLAALAACQETTYRIYAEDMGVEIEKIAVKLTGKQDLRGFMALDKKIPAGFSKIEGEVRIVSKATNDELKELQTLVDKYCPVLDDLTRQVPVDIQVNKVKSPNEKNLIE